MNIVDWFDPKNLDHLTAYVSLQRHGSWPVGFIPNGITFPPAWAVLIASKIADHYLYSILKF